MPQQTLTTISRPRYRQLIKGWLDGSLQEKWKDGHLPQNRKERVEANQIRAIGMIFAECDDRTSEVLRGDDWTEIRLIKVGNVVKLEIVG